MNYSSIPTYFPVLESISSLFFILKFPDAWGPPVGLLPTPGPTCQNLISTWCPGRTSSSTCLLPPAAHTGIQLGPTAVVRRTLLEVLSEILHHHRLTWAAGERGAVAVVELDRQPTLPLPSAVSHRPRSASSGCRLPHPPPFHAQDRRALIREELAPRAARN
jgi:hypothetical protein